MNIVDNSGKGLAALGRNEDRFMAHVAQGEMVVPPVISDNTKALIRQEMRAVGLNPQEYEVGQGMSINPITGQAEFGFLKKLAKSVKKVVKKVAPIAAVIPGPWQPAAIAYNRGRAVISLAKGEGGIGDLITAFTPAKAYTGGPTGNIFGNTKEFFTKGADGVGFFGNVGKGLGNIKEFVTKGSDGVGLFGNTIGKAYEYVMPGDDGVGLYGNLTGGGVKPETDTLKYDPVNQGYINIKTGMPATAAEVASIPGNRNMITEMFTGDKSPVEYLSSKLLPQSVEDALNTGPGNTNTSSSGGINPQMAALALLYGKAVKDFTKKTEGGLTDIRQSIRPDLNPAPVFAGFDLGVRKAAAFGGPIGYGRQNFNKGGLAAIGELDMRNGGESAGPGTGTSDDIPAMLSDGEFVMTAAANNGAGGFKLNKTKKGIELIASSKPNRKKGVDVMNKLMDTFEKYNASGSIMASGSDCRLCHLKMRLWL
jgi:hypothetical protein